MSDAPPARRTDLVVGDVNDDQETVLLEPATGRAVSLNTTAAAVWFLCNGERRVAEIAEAIRAVHPSAPVSQVEADVRRILDEFREKQLLA